MPRPRPRLRLRCAPVEAAAEAEAYLRKVQVNSAGHDQGCRGCTPEQQEKARIALARSNNKPIETEEKSHLTPSHACG